MAFPSFYTMSRIDPRFVMYLNLQDHKLTKAQAMAFDQIMIPNEQAMAFASF